MTHIPLRVDPAPLVIDRLSEIMRKGYPDISGFRRSPEWPDPRASAPPGHWILPEGSALITGEDLDEIECPTCLIYSPGETTPQNEQNRIWWLVPVSIEICMDRIHSEGAIREVIQLMQFAFCEDFPEHPARHRLSSSALCVGAIRDVKPALAAKGGENNEETLLGVGFTLLCSAIDVQAS